jgi:hypothetical protein
MASNIPTSGLWSFISGLINANFTAIEARTGWGAYDDTAYTPAAPLSLSANTDTVLPNNKGSTIESQKPGDVATFYDGSVITGREGDGLAFTLECKAIPVTGTNTFFEIWLDIGGTIGPIYRRTIPFVKGVAEHSINVSVNAYQLNTWQANGATVYVRANTACTIHSIRYVLTRTHKAR